MRINGKNLINTASNIKNNIIQRTPLKDIPKDEIVLAAKKIAKPRNIIAAILSATALTAAAFGISSCSYNKGANDTAEACGQLIEDLKEIDYTSSYIDDVDSDGANDVVISNSETGEMTIYHLNRNEKFYHKKGERYGKTTKITEE